MNPEHLSEALREKVKPKFKGRRTLKARAALHCPESAMREYMRVTNAYMTLFNKTLAAHLPKIRRAIDAEREAMRHDSAYDVLGMTRREFDLIVSEFAAKARKFGLDDKLQKIADRTVKMSVSEWKRVVHQTLGVNILDDYYLGGFFRDNLTSWVKGNVSLIKSIPQDMLMRVEGIIEQGYLNGMSNTAIGRQIQGVYGTERKRAQFIARDQVASLSAGITKKQHEDAGVDSYIWSASRDARVRDCHNDFDGKQYKWSEPPEDYYETKSRGRVYTGSRYNPGEGIGCRCVALPVFDIEGVSMPWQDDKDGGYEQGNN